MKIDLILIKFDIVPHSQNRPYINQMKTDLILIKSALSRIVKTDLILIKFKIDLIIIKWKLSQIRPYINEKISSNVELKLTAYNCFSQTNRIYHNAVLEFTLKNMIIQGWDPPGLPYLYGRCLRCNARVTRGTRYLSHPWALSDNATSRGVVAACPQTFFFFTGV